MIAWQEPMALGIFSLFPDVVKKIPGESFKS